MDERLALADVLAALRSELYESMVRAQGAVIQFVVGNVDLEFQVVLEKTGGVSGKINFWVVELGGEGSVSSSSTQVIKLQLTPVDAVTGGPVKAARVTQAPSDPGPAQPEDVPTR